LDVVTGLMVSTRTETLWVLSQLPATSTDANVTVLVPCADTLTPVVYVAAAEPFRLYRVPATPDPASVAPSKTLTGVPLQPAGALATVLGVMRSMRTTAVLTVSVLPALSTDWKRTVVDPSAEMTVAAVASTAGALPSRE